MNHRNHARRLAEEEYCSECDSEDLDASYLRRERRRNGESSDEEEMYEEPPWASHVQEKGVLFYIEPYNDPSNGFENSENLESTSDISSENSERQRSNNNALGKLRKIIPGMKRDKDVGNTDSLNNDLTVNGLNLLNSPGVKRGKKIVKFVVNPSRNMTRTMNPIESVLGIIAEKNHSRSVTWSGDNINQDNFKSSTKDDRIVIKGFVPNGAAIASQELKIGDIVLQLNGLDLNHNNASILLSAISQPTEITLTVTKPPEIKTMPPTVINKPSPKNDNHLLKVISGVKPATKQPISDLKNVPHIIMYLTLEGMDEEQPDKDIVYCYPDTKESNKFILLRGIFLTLSDLLVTVTGSHASSSSLLMGQRLVHVGYCQSGRHVLVMALPADRISLYHVQQLLSETTRVLTVMFGSLKSAFCEKCNHARVSHLMSLLFENLLGKAASKTNMEFCTQFTDSLTGVRWLNLPPHTEVDVNNCLSELEAADYGELADDYFQIRRQYTVLGSCLFYKGMLVCSHLPTDDLVDVVLYCKFYSLLTVSSEQRVGQLIIWTEIFPSRRRKHTPQRPPDGYHEPNGRWFLLIVGLKHCLCCVILEAGGIAVKTEGNPGPDNYYVEQVRDALMNIEILDIPSVCESKLRLSPVPSFVSADSYVHSSNSSPDKLSIDTPQKLRHGHSLDSLRVPGTTDENESDAGSLNNTPVIRRKGSDSSEASRGSIGSGGKGRVNMAKTVLNTVGTLRKSLSEAHLADNLSANTRLTYGEENTLFQYISFDSYRGLILCPTSLNNMIVGGVVHVEVVKHFQRSCSAIRRMFQQYYKKTQISEKSATLSKFTDSVQLQDVIEHGVMFVRKPSNWTDPRKSPPVLKYWVIGRLYPGPHPHEFYVCYHDSSAQNVVELAFKLGFGLGL